MALLTYLGDLEMTAVEVAKKCLEAKDSKIKSRMTYELLAEAVIEAEKMLRGDYDAASVKRKFKHIYENNLTIVPSEQHGYYMILSNENEILFGFGRFQKWLAKFAEKEGE